MEFGVPWGRGGDCGVSGLSDRRETFTSDTLSSITHTMCLSLFLSLYVALRETRFLSERNY